MRLRPAMTLIAAATAIAVAPPAAEAKRSTSLTVRDCETGDSASERFATFYGRMRRVPRTRRMMMRFKLVESSSGETSEVQGPRGLSRWRKSRRGVRSFGYSQTITGLKSGGTYAAAVEFRWIDRRGRRIKTVKRTSRECHQDGKLPNLEVRRITARPGAARRTAKYSIDVTNRGRGEARSVAVDLFVDNAAADAARIEVLAPGETVTVEVSGPACRFRVRAVVDRRNAIPETTEDDNTLRRLCRNVQG